MQFLLSNSFAAISQIFIRIFLFLLNKKNKWMDDKRSLLLWIVSLNYDGLWSCRMNHVVLHNPATSDLKTLAHENMFILSTLTFYLYTIFLTRVGHPLPYLRLWCPFVFLRVPLKGSPITWVEWMMDNPAVQSDVSFFCHLAKIDHASCWSVSRLSVMILQKRKFAKSICDQ